MATKKEIEDKEPRETEEKEPKEGAVEVKLDEDDGDDDEDKGQGGQAGPTAASRSDRRRERGKERYAEVQRQAREALERSERLERELHEERTRRTVEDAMRRQQGGASPRDDDKRYDEKMADIRKRMAGKLQALRGVQDEGATQALAQEYQDLQGDLEEARIERALARRPAAAAAPPVASTEQSMLQYEFPDVFGDSRKKRWASGVYEQLVADGAPEGLETAKQAARQTRQKYNGSHSPSPATATQQQRYAGTPASGGAPPASNTVRIPANLMKIAKAKYPKLDEDEAYKRFARDMRRAEVL